VGDLYQRVYTLPDRIAKARAKVAKIKTTMEFVDRAERHSYKGSLDRAERRVRALETEARQFNFFDLLETVSDC
jgi:polyhydroxyalkanoate synthesis regulator phasin